MTHLERAARYRTLHPERVKADRDKRRRENRALANAHKAERGCVDCGESDPVVLDFDHRDPREKTASIAHLMHHRIAWDTIMTEIRKCDVRCANCHRRRTLAQKMAGEIE